MHNGELLIQTYFPKYFFSLWKHIQLQNYDYYVTVYNIIILLILSKVGIIYYNNMQGKGLFHIFIYFDLIGIISSCLITNYIINRYKSHNGE